MRGIDLPPTPSYDDLILSTGGLLLYWPLGEGAGTKARNLRWKLIADGVYAGGFTLGKAGPVGGASGVLLNGSTGKITAAATSAMNLTNGPLTIEAWVKRAGIGTDQGILSKASGAYYFRIRGSDNKLDFLRSQQADIAISNVALTDTTQWHHVAVTYAGSDGAYHFFIDGADVSTTGPWTSSLTNNATALTIGCDNNGSGDFFNGSLARVALYGRALSVGEIAMRASYVLDGSS